MTLPIGRPGDSMQIIECAHCYSPLYARQPMKIIRCAGSTTLNCPRLCQPDVSCAAYVLEALHVGCAVELERHPRL